MDSDVTVIKCLHRVEDTFTGFPGAQTRSWKLSSGPSPKLPPRLLERRSQVYMYWDKSKLER